MPDVRSFPPYFSHKIETLARCMESDSPLKVRPGVSESECTNIANFCLDFSGYELFFLLNSLNKIINEFLSRVHSSFFGKLESCNLFSKIWKIGKTLLKRKVVDNRHFVLCQRSK